MYAIVTTNLPTGPPLTNAEEAVLLILCADYLYNESQDKARCSNEWCAYCLNLAIELYSRCLCFLPAFPHPDLYTPLGRLENALWERYSTEPRREDLSRLSAFTRMLALFHPSLYHATVLYTDAHTVFVRFQDSNNQIYLDKAIKLYRKVSEACGPEHPRSVMFLSNFSLALQIRCALQGQQGDDIEELISLQKRLLALPSLDNYTRWVFTTALWSLLLTQYCKEHQLPVLEDAIIVQREGLKLLKTNQAIYLDKLASSLRYRFEHLGRQQDVEEAVSLHRQALEHLPLLHPNRLNLLENFVLTIQAQFHNGGEPRNLDEVIALCRQAHEHTPPQHGNHPWAQDQAAILHNLRKGAQHGQLSLASTAVPGDLLFPIKTAPSTSTIIKNPKVTSLRNLATVLKIVFYYNGRQCDLDEAISLFREIVALEALSDSARQSQALDDLALALRNRFDYLGQQRDVDEAISLHRQSLELQANAPRSGRFTTTVNNLAGVLQRRSHNAAQNKADDIAEAISLFELLIEDREPDDHNKHKVWLSNLGFALLDRYKINGGHCDLDNAIALFREALKFCPPFKHNRSGILNNVAGALQLRFHLKGEWRDLDEAVSLHRESLDVLGHDTSRPEYPYLLNHLATTLWVRVKERRQKSDIEEMVSLLTLSLERSSVSHPNRYLAYRGLAEVRLLQYSMTLEIQAANTKILEQAMSAFESSVMSPSQNPFTRLEVAKTWAKHADSHNHFSAIQAYKTVLHALSEVSSLALPVHARQTALAASGSDGLARKAAICALRTGQLESAVELLDAGRAIMWAQLLQLRSPVDALCAMAPALGQRLLDIARALESGAHRKLERDEMLDNSGKMSIEAQEAQFSRLNEEWRAILEEVRKVDGFESFLQPSSFTWLAGAAAGHPVVFLIPDKSESHCLIMTATGSSHIVLEDMSSNMVYTLVYLIQNAISSSGRSIDESILEDRASMPPGVADTLEEWVEDRLKGRKQGASIASLSSDDIFRSVLTTLWKGAVEHVIKALELQKSDMPSARVLWCPTGLFTFLPIHAAGNYDFNGLVDCAFDYMVSSYTPTASALLPKDTVSRPVPFDTFDMLVVVDPKLPSTSKEIKVISDRIPSECMLRTLGGSYIHPASVQDVLSHLPQATIIHFACHAVQHRTQPLQSALLLTDGPLTIAQIMKQSYPQGSLAFLGACETGMGATELPDEAMSLGASMLFSGFSNVVATMWKMADKDGPTISSAFYEELFKGKDGDPVVRPDFSKSSCALHVAVKRLRDRGVEFRRWVPFVHLGK